MKKVSNDDKAFAEWAETFEQVKPVQLNGYQQIVLEWLQGDIQKRNPFASIKTLVCRAEFDSDSLSDEVKKAYNKLDKNQEFHVLRTVGEWGLSRETP